MSSSTTSQIPLVVRVEQRITLPSNRTRHSFPFSAIYRVPDNMRSSNDHLYVPRVVSIGPYHYHLRENELRQMEDHKWQFLSAFVGTNGRHAENYIKELQLIEEEVRRSYTENIALESDDLIEMLLLDGCFIIQLSLMWCNEDYHELFEARNLPMILSDLLLCENQIPFVVIERLYKVFLPENKRYHRDKFLSLLLKFVTNKEPSHRLRFCSTGIMLIPHFLQLYHFSLLDPLPCCNVPVEPLIDSIARRLNLRKNRRLPRWIPSATELDKVGVKFRKRLRPNDLFDVKFKRGTFEIPLLKIDSNTMVLLTNLVQLERNQSRENRVVTGYMVLMDSLIRRKEDMELLRHAGTIVNMLSSDKEALDFLCQLHDSIERDSSRHFFTPLFCDVKLHYNSDWRRLMAALIRGYCNSPVAIVAWIAGAVLLGLVALQTFYTAYTYYRRN